jgi:hypothetical protein
LFTGVAENPKQSRRILDEEDEKLYMTQIIKYLKRIKPLVSINKLERLANIPQGTLNKAFSGGRALPDVHVFPLMKVLIRILGVVAIDKWRYTAKDDDSVIFVERDVNAQEREFYDAIGIAELLNDNDNTNSK